MLIIPAVDIKDGLVVRLYQGDFSKQSEYKTDPLSAALHWQTLGAKLIHVVDLNGALEGIPKNKDWLIKIIKELDIDVEVGGGLRDAKIINELLDVGAARVTLGSKVFSDFSFLDNFSSILSEKISVSIDAKFMKLNTQEGIVSDIIMEVANSGWKKSSEVSLNDCFKKIYDKGVRFVNFTNIKLDGTMSGVDVQVISAVISRANVFPGLKLIASGGVGSIADIEKLKKIPGLFGVIVGKALYEGRLDFKQAVKVAEGS
jgi:phosphoribosylformimino-5-aminoimidazole carboxamide ribotide isomerase